MDAGGHSDGPALEACAPGWSVAGRGVPGGPIGAPEAATEWAARR